MTIFNKDRYFLESFKTEDKEYFNSLKVFQDINEDYQKTDLVEFIENSDDASDSHIKDILKSVNKSTKYFIIVMKIVLVLFFSSVYINFSLELLKSESYIYLSLLGISFVAALIFSFMFLNGIKSNLYFKTNKEILDTNTSFKRFMSKSKTIESLTSELNKEEKERFDTLLFVGYFNFTERRKIFFNLLNDKYIKNEKITNEDLEKFQY